DAQEAEIALYDIPNLSLRYPFAIEKDVRLNDPDHWFKYGPMVATVVASRSLLRIDDVERWSQDRGVDLVVPAGEPTKWVVMAPLIIGEQLRGHIGLQNVDRTNAFSDSDVRLLSTLAGSLAVALENARLFDETQRLLTETNERAAELAIINSVQQG